MRYPDATVKPLSHFNKLNAVYLRFTNRSPWLRLLSPQAMGLLALAANLALASTMLSPRVHCRNLHYYGRRVSATGRVAVRACETFLKHCTCHCLPFRGEARTARLWEDSLAFSCNRNLSTVCALKRKEVVPFAHAYISKPLPLET